jgi:teichuronic acid biosynthesis glycosyltransferase TuaC
MYEDCNLLVITQAYFSFVKSPIEIISKNFNHVYVLVRHNPFAEISNFLPINSLKQFRKNFLIDLTAKSENITVIPTPILYLPTKSGYKKLGDQHLTVVKKIIKKNKIHFDLIHSHFTWTSGYVGINLKEIFDVPSVLTVHENGDWLLKEYESKNEKIYNTWKSTDAIIRVNKIDIPKLKQFNKKVNYLPNGFSPGKFFPIDQITAKKELGISAEKRVIFSLGQLIERKGFQFLIDAINSVVKKRNDVLNIIGGVGGYKNYLERKITSLDLKDYIKLIGFVPHDQLNLWMNAADFFVLPSLSEGTPTVMFEAFGCGKPFIGTKVGGNQEIIISEDYGLLCEPADSKDLAEKILIGLDKQWDKNKIIEYANEFTWNNITKELLKIYADILEK